jgi:hypothetical protein
MPRSGARTGEGGRRSGSSSLLPSWLVHVIMWTASGFTPSLACWTVDRGCLVSLFCYSCGQWLVWLYLYTSLVCWLVHARVLICCFIGALSASIYGLKFIENIVAFISWPLVVVVYIPTKVPDFRLFLPSFRLCRFVSVHPFISRPAPNIEVRERKRERGFSSASVRFQP